ncbi:hypothetical protein QBC34DRAFT_111953 [Podospora aff. communis PSN243]|uniref:Uncharacterized protein n=1 Tax=Podospora aff. communis PSN243 TaxID=3040156 RepID=A0AAV9GPP3_9PEZI|nr:hypothetical protein QBC34DRAFT_111953 [Podospora aff. communis PSN243]
MNRTRPRGSHESRPRIPPETRGMWAEHPPSSEADRCAAAIGPCFVVQHCLRSASRSWEYHHEIDANAAVSRTDNFCICGSLPVELPNHTVSLPRQSWLCHEVISSSSQCPSRASRHGATIGHWATSCRPCRRFVLCAIHSTAVVMGSHNASPRQRRNLACHDTELAKKKREKCCLFRPLPYIVIPHSSAPFVAHKQPPCLPQLTIHYPEQRRIYTGA